MESILSKVDFETHGVYSVTLSVSESDMFENAKEGEVDEYGQSLDIVSELRRAIKYSFPFENKKIIKSIVAEDEKENEDGVLCRDIELEYYLLVDKEDMEEFSIEELHDVLEEEWNGGNAACKIAIDLYES